MAEGHWEKLRRRAVYARILKTPMGQTTEFRWLRACLSRFLRGWPQKGPFGPFWAPGGQGPIRKRQFGRHAKTAVENGSNPVKLLKSHVRREKGPTRGPGGPSVAGRGALHSVSGAKTKKFEVPILPREVP